MTNSRRNYNPRKEAHRSGSSARKTTETSCRPVRVSYMWTERPNREAIRPLRLGRLRAISAASSTGSRRACCCNGRTSRRCSFARTPPRSNATCSVERSRGKIPRTSQADRSGCGWQKPRYSLGKPGVPVLVRGRHGSRGYEFFPGARLDRARSAKDPRAGRHNGASRLFWQSSAGMVISTASRLRRQRDDLPGHWPGCDGRIPPPQKTRGLAPGRERVGGPEHRAVGRDERGRARRVPETQHPPPDARLLTLRRHRNPPAGAENGQAGAALARRHDHRGRLPLALRQRHRERDHGQCGGDGEELPLPRHGGRSAVRAPGPRVRAAR